MRDRNYPLNKKGQLNSLAPAILALVFAAIVLVFGLIMTQGIVDTQDGTVASASVANESLTITAGSSISGEISGSDNCGYTGWNASTILNGSATNAGANGTLVEGTFYTINANGSITNLTALTGGATSVRATHTYNTGGEACRAGNLTVVGLGTFADFWEIIVLAVVIAVVIGLLLVIFGGAAGARRR